MDPIERQQALDILDDYSNDVIEIWHGSYETARREMCELPSAQPERKTGHWIYHPDWRADGECGFECSECGMGSDVDFPYCMRCGAKMVGDNFCHHCGAVMIGTVKNGVNK